MNRRDVLRYAATLTGASIFAPLSTQVLASALNITEKPQFFDAETFKAIGQIMDVILPKTESPSATEVNSHFIMDNLFNKVFDAAYQQRFLSRFAELNDYLTQQGFYTSSAKQKLAVLTQLESTKAEPNQAKVYQAYIDLKQQTISYYLTTEEIAENFLNYLPIPGGYEPCISVKEVGGKAWAI